MAEEKKAGRPKGLLAQVLYVTQVEQEELFWRVAPFFLVIALYYYFH